MLKKALTASFVIFAILALAGIARAGGPFVVDSVNFTGVAQRWVNDKLYWCADDGKLSNSVNNVEAKQWISDALNMWTSVTLKNSANQSVSTTAIQTEINTACGFGDIDITNYDDHVYSSAGPTVVIFDDTGDIIAEVMGEENREYVVGASQPIASDASGLHIVKGVAIFNGLLLDNGVLADTSSASEALFKGTILHELGHLLNLDHSQVNYDIAQACVRNGTCDYAYVIPTMYPELKTPMQGEVLTRDDQVTISWIYPTTDFEEDFCTITGEIFDADGEPLKGVNVIAKNALGGTAPMVDARAFVTGVLKPACYGDSRYYLRGIKPNVPYKVEYEAIGSEFTGASDFEPLDNPPRGFPSGSIESSGGDTTVMCTEGGQTIQMASVTIDTANPCAGFSGADGDTSSADGKSSCSFVMLCDADMALLGLIVILMLAAIPRFARVTQRIDS